MRRCVLRQQKVENEDTFPILERADVDLELVGVGIVVQFEAGESIAGHGS